MLTYKVYICESQKHETENKKIKNRSDKIKYLSIALVHSVTNFVMKQLHDTVFDF